MVKSLGWRWSLFTVGTGLFLMDIQLAPWTVVMGVSHLVIGFGGMVLEERGFRIFDRRSSWR